LLFRKAWLGSAAQTAVQKSIALSEEGKKMTRKLGILASLGLCLLLPACGGNSGGGGGGDSGAPNGGSGGGGSGGGSGGGGPPVVNASAEGAWSGTDSSGHSFDMLVLENGDLYSLFGNGFQALGFIQGASSVSGSTLKAPAVTEFYYASGSVLQATGGLSATVVPDVSLKGSSTGNATSTFSATPTKASYSGYDYATPAKLSDIALGWNGYLLDQTGTYVAIDTTGVLSGTNFGCHFNGTVTPRPSGKNVFNVSYTFDTSITTGCSAPGVTVTGVAISYVLPSGKRRLLFATQDSSKQLGYLFYAEH
jgi:hypothetical protein